MQRVRVCPVVLLLILVSGVALCDTVHVMAAGDTIYSLAREYGVSASDIISYNQISDPTRIRIGTEIRIPSDASETYTVQRGEYIYSIARKLGVDWLDLLAANNLDREDVVRPGDVLVVPRGPAADTPPSNAVDGASDAMTDAPDPADSDPPDDPFVTPAATAVVGAVDWPHPGTREPWEGRFPGIVIQGEAGDAFHSVATGVVKIVTPYGTFGQLILIEGSDGYLYAYAGADRIDVGVGDRVAAGTALGSIGFSPAFQSTKVLFAVWHNNRYVDPESAPRG